MFLKKITYLLTEQSKRKYFWIEIKALLPNGNNDHFGSDPNRIHLHVYLLNNFENCPIFFNIAVVKIKWTRRR